MNNSFTKYFTLKYFFYFITLLGSTLFVISFLLNLNLSDMLDPFYRGMLTGVILLYFMLIVLNFFNLKYNVLGNGVKNEKKRTK